MYKALPACLLGLFLLLLYSLFHLPMPKPGEPPRLYCNQCRDDLTRLSLRAIEKATRSIHILMYNLSSPHLIAALEKKRREGVEVVLVVEEHEGRALRSKLDPAIELIPRKARGLMHQKILVVDERQVWIGSANWTPTSLRNHSNLVIGMEAPELASLLVESCVSRLDGTEPPHLAARRFDVGGEQIEYWQLPTDRQALDRVIGLIDQAQEQIRILLFTWTHPQLTERVIAAHRRGVRVEVVIDGYAGAGSSRKTVEELVTAGVRVRLSLGPELLHHKLLWIDEVTLVCGSANWTRAAFTKNDDAFVVLYPLTRAQRKKMKALWRAAWIEAERVALSQQMDYSTQHEDCTDWLWQNGRNHRPIGLKSRLPGYCSA
jgi:phosphatidylserine/phosphatidylglycerophosphate/cardiolipin synthase-like enzyme